MQILAKKSFGQHWLKSQAVVTKIVAAAQVSKSDTILEIGPGTGILTKALVETGAKVIAVEADKTLYENLNEKFGSNIKLIESDVLKVSNHDLAGKARTYKLVANLPYNVASRILRKFLTESPKPKSLVVMIQKEVADRILAEPPKMSVLTVMCQLYSTAQRVTNVKPGSFSPPPKVDSAVIKLTPEPLSRYQLKNMEGEAVMQLVKAGFASKRKQLHKNLALAKIVSSDRTKQILAKIGLSELARAEELSVKDWVVLFRSISKLK